MIVLLIILSVTLHFDEFHLVEVQSTSSRETDCLFRGEREALGLGRGRGLKSGDISRVVVTTLTRTWDCQ